MTAAEFAPAGMPPTGEVRVWWASIDVGRDVVSALRAELDDATVRRLARFVNEVDRRRGTVGHGLLRRVIGATTGTAPGDVRFGVRCGGCGSTEHGKPYVLPPPGGQASDAPQVNLSHSGHLVAVALGDAATPVGVDVERVRSGPDWAQLRRNVFTDAEWEGAAADPDPHRARYRFWVAKEAVLKATGTGLSVSMRDVPVGSGAALPTGADARTEAFPPGGTTVFVAPVGLDADHLAAVASLVRMRALSVRRVDFCLP